MVDRGKVIKGLETCSDVYYGADGACSSCPYSQTNGDRCLAELVHDAIDLLKEQEAVVRCKDCKECYFASNRVPHEQSWACGKHGIDVTPDWFCADGERR